MNTRRVMAIERGEGKSRPTRVLVVTPVLGGIDYFGGIPASVDAYRRLCEELGIEVRTIAGIRIPGSYFEGDFLTRGTWRFASRLGWCRGREFITCIQGVKWADIVLVHAWFHVMARFASWLAIRVGKPWILVPHGTLMAPALKQRSWKKRCEIILGGRQRLRSATVVLFATTLEGKLSQAILHAEATTDIVPPPLVLGPKIFSKLDKTDNLFRIGFLGRFHKSKRLDLMLEACRQSTGTDLEFELVMAGPDEQNLAEPLSKQYSELFACGRASFKRPVSGREKNAFLAGIDVLILLSAFESYGLVIVEAWAQGTPCVVAQTVGLADEVEKKYGGVVLADLSTSSILQAVHQVKSHLREGIIQRPLLQAMAVNYGEKLPKAGLKRGFKLCGVSFPQVSDN